MLGSPVLTRNFTSKRKETKFKGINAIWFWGLGRGSHSRARFISSLTRAPVCPPIQVLQSGIVASLRCRVDLLLLEVVYLLQ